MQRTNLGRSNTMWVFLKCVFYLLFFILYASMTSSVMRETENMPCVFLVVLTGICRPCLASSCLPSLKIDCCTYYQHCLTLYSPPPVDGWVAQKW